MSEAADGIGGTHRRYDCTPIQWCVESKDSLMPEPSVISSRREVMGGTPVFRGTRVPIKTLFDYLEAGDPLDRFLDHFPSVSRDQAVEALASAGRAIVGAADAHPVR